MSTSASSSDPVVARVRPVAFRDRPLSTAVTCVLLLFSSGVWVAVRSNPSYWPSAWAFFAFTVFLVCSLASRLLVPIGTSLTVTHRRVILRRGIVSRSLSEVRIRDIRAITVHQGILERIVGVGRIGISSAGQSDVEILIEGIPGPHAVADTIRALQD